MQAQYSASPAQHFQITPDNDVCNTPPTHSADQYIITLTISIIRVVLELGICWAKHSSEREKGQKKRERELSSSNAACMGSFAKGFLLSFNNGWRATIELRVGMSLLALTYSRPWNADPKKEKLVISKQNAKF